MIVDSEQAYEDHAVQLANSVAYSYVDRIGHVLEPVTPARGTTAAALGAAAAPAISQPGGPGTAPLPQVPHAELAAAAPPRESIFIARGPQAPPGAVSRRGHGELSDLRRHLFLTRDKIPLFDTRAWTRALERGYEEAWRRWVAGTDTEDSPEWEALPEDAPEKRSGHIWLRPEDGAP